MTVLILQSNLETLIYQRFQDTRNETIATWGAISKESSNKKLLLFFATYRCYSRGCEAVNCLKGFALPVEAMAKPLKTLKLAFQNFAKAKAEMASFELGVVGSSPFFQMYTDIVQSYWSYCTYYCNFLKFNLFLI